MIKYDYGKRMKTMASREIALEKRELALGKLSYKYHEKLQNLEIRYAQQTKNFFQINQTIQEQKRYCEQLEKMIEDAQAHLTEAAASVQKHVEETVENRLQLNKQLDEIHMLKLATKTFINLKALPERIQGVWVQTTQNKTSWHPFCVEPLSHTPEELQKIIWGDSEFAASYSEAWERLVFHPVREMLQKMS